MEKEGIALNISREWYIKVFNEYVLQKYGSLEVLQKYDLIRDGEIRNYMYKQIVEYYKIEANDVVKCMRENARLCNECINKYK